MKIAKHRNYKVRIVKNKDGKKDVHVDMNGSIPLFRYRPINEHTIQQFVDDSLFATVPSAFNDPYDATVRFSTQKIKKHIKGKLMQNTTFLSYLLQLNHLKEKQINKLVDMIYNRDLSPNINFGNDSYCVACFSTDITQEIMWAHYADSATGFALEYDFRELNNLGYDHQFAILDLMKELVSFAEHDFSQCKIECPLLPVIYTNEKYDVTDFCNDYIDIVLQKIESKGSYNPLMVAFELIMKNKNDNNDYFIQNVFFRKKTPWCYENEWRLIRHNFGPIVDLNSNYCCIGYVIPKAIYLGEKITKYNEDALIAIAKNKGIAVYKMRTSIVGSTLKLKPIKINY